MFPSEQRRQLVGWLVDGEAHERRSHSALLRGRLKRCVEPPEGVEAALRGRGHWSQHFSFQEAKLTAVVPEIMFFSPQLK